MPIEGSFATKSATDESFIGLKYFYRVFFLKFVICLLTTIYLCEYNFIIFFASVLFQVSDKVRHGSVNLISITYCVISVESATTPSAEPTAKSTRPKPATKYFGIRSCCTCIWLVTFNGDFSIGIDTSDTCTGLIRNLNSSEHQYEEQYNISQC